MAFFKKATNTILSIPEIEVKVKDATNNEPWGPSGSQIADFSVIMNVIWKRLNDQGKYWRHVYKALLLLDYLLKNGSEQVVRETKVHLVEIQTLTQFAHIDEKDKDVGVSVRERAKHIVDLVSDDNRIKQEREKCLKNQGKWTNAISSEGYAPPPSSSASNYSSPPMGSSPPPVSASASSPQHGRKDDSSDDEVAAPQQPGQRPAYAQAEMYAVMSGGQGNGPQGGAPQYPQSAMQPQYPQAAMQPQQYGQPAPQNYGGAPMGNNPYSSPQGSGAAPITAAQAGLFGPGAGGQGAVQARPPTYASPQAGSQGALFGAPQGGNPYAQPAQHGGGGGGFQGNYGAPASAYAHSNSEEFFNPRVGHGSAAAPALAPAPAPAVYNPYSVTPAPAPANSNPFGGASVSAGNSSGVTAAQLGLFGQPQQGSSPAPSASPFAPVSAPVMAAPASSSASPFAPAASASAPLSGAPAGMQVMYTPSGQPIYVMNSAPPANAPVYVLVNGQLVPASQAGGHQ